LSLTRRHVLIGQIYTNSHAKKKSVPSRGRPFPSLSSLVRSSGCIRNVYPLSIPYFRKRYQIQRTLPTLHKLSPYPYPFPCNRTPPSLFLRSFLATFLGIHVRQAHRLVPHSPLDRPPSMLLHTSPLGMPISLDDDRNSLALTLGCLVVLEWSGALG